MSKTPIRQVIAMGGGGCLMEPKNPALDRYVLAQARTRTPSVCFVATASGDSQWHVARFYAGFKKLRCRPSHVPLFRRTPDLGELLLAQDVIYVGGGNTKSMLAVWREWGVDRLLRRAWRNGTVLAGVSAGAICWFDYGVTDSWADRYRLLPCLGLLSGTCCPHYDGEEQRRPAVHELVARRVAPTTLALDDGTAAHFIGRKLHRIVSSRPTARSYRVRRVGTTAKETALPVLRLPIRRTGKSRAT